MIKTNPKNARAKRALEKKESKLVENVKTALFIQGSTGTRLLHDAMCDLSAFKKPDIKRFQKKNDIKPFEDASPLEFFSEKNDCSLIVFSSSNKKRPNNLTFIRTFGYKIYDMIELRIQKNHKLLIDFRKTTFQLGLKPMFVFNGPVFDSHPTFKHVKSLFLDFFRGQTTDLQDVAGLQYVITLTAAEVEEGKALPSVYFRVYKLKSYRSGQKLPRIELEEIGPRFDFTIGRVEQPSPELEKEAMKKPKQLETKTKKNIETDGMGDKVGTIHVGKQDLGELQTRKMKGLKSRFDQVGEDFDDQEYEYANDEVVEDYEPAQKKQKV
ncbi:rRNA-binding ribosome biosynthesis protein [Saccharomycopsis crataegensis]|uniref:Ribosome production factor 2 homolog n=1 Tax=Saccharomycopsis crataegensis TaxID=43959 RepID=A0AAV5QGH5_9ASCO|nr:rRNA-binding ribosome biosynthesis protein [Saccharomycopsis crataegensis]